MLIGATISDESKSTVNGCFRCNFPSTDLKFREETHTRKSVPDRHQSVLAAFWRGTTKPPAPKGTPRTEVAYPSRLSAADLLPRLPPHTVARGLEAVDHGFSATWLNAFLPSP